MSSYRFARDKQSTTRRKSGAIEGKRKAVAWEVERGSVDEKTTNAVDELAGLLDLISSNKSNRPSEPSHDSESLPVNSSTTTKTTSSAGSKTRSELMELAASRASKTNALETDLEVRLNRLLRSRRSLFVEARIAPVTIDALEAATDIVEARLRSMRDDFRASVASITALKEAVSTAIQEL